MSLKVEIDEGSGFCFGVTRAIDMAEQRLRSGETLHCLGDIVHNDSECHRLSEMGMLTIGHDALATMPEGSEVLLRAHGEPPSTYALARKRGICLEDATCPVVLRLQRRIAAEYAAGGDKQIVIFGKRGHAEVLGLVGQTEGTAIVVESIDDARRLDFHRDIRLYSQTTRAISQFMDIVDYIGKHIQVPATFEWHDTICRQVAGRMPEVRAFAACHDVVVFVAGGKSSNGHVLFEAVREVNARSYCIERPAEIQNEWFAGAASVGICGATSTPRWLMEQCAEAVKGLKV